MITDAEGRELESLMGCSAVEKLCHRCLKAVEGEGWGLSFICYAQDTVDFQHPLLLWPSRYEKIFTFQSICD